MYFYIHLSQYANGIDAKFAAETKQLCKVFVTARAHATHPISATVVRYLASSLIDPPCLASVSSFHLPYQYTYLFTWLYVLFKEELSFEFVLM